MLNRKITFLAAAVAALAGLPAIGQARAHYTGTVPASVMLAATTPVRSSVKSRGLTAIHRHSLALSHKKATATVKHKKLSKKKKHKKSKKA